MKPKSADFITVVGVTHYKSKLDSLAIKTLERHSLNVKMCHSNVLITGESDSDEKNVREMFT